MISGCLHFVPLKKESFLGKNSQFWKTQKYGILRIPFSSCKVRYLIIWRRILSQNYVRRFAISPKTVVLIPEVSNAFSGCRNLHKNDSLLVVSVMVSFLFRSSSFRRTRNAEIQFFSISSLSTTNNHLKLKLLLKWDWFTIRMYHSRYTQEFQNLFSDELAVFLEKSSIVRNT